MLWAIGLVDKSSNYNGFIIYDLHPYLQIGPEHSLNVIVNDFKIRSVYEINIEKFQCYGIGVALRIEM